MAMAGMLKKVRRTGHVCRRYGKLNAARRRNLPDKAFGLPDKRAYPMPDPRHAANAKARAKQQLKKRRLSRKEYDKIVRKADRVIKACGGV